MFTSRTCLGLFVAVGLTGSSAMMANGQTSSKPSSSTQHATGGAHCGYFGDGMGYVCEGGTSTNSSGVSTGGTSAGVSAAGLTPRTDFGSAYMNAVQGFFTGERLFELNG
jgi:hypothetical protein